MADPALTMAAFLYWIVPALLLVAGVFYVAYLAHDLSARRREAALRPEPVGPEPTIELARLNAETRNALAEGRNTLEQARETLRRGIRG